VSAEKAKDDGEARAANAGHLATVVAGSASQVNRLACNDKEKAIGTIVCAKGNVANDATKLDSPNNMLDKRRSLARWTHLLVRPPNGPLLHNPPCPPPFLAHRRSAKEKTTAKQPH
jgi:hypothetical protein